MRFSKFQFVVRRWLFASVVGMLLGMAAPGLASADQTFAIGDTHGGNTFPANGNVPYSTTMSLDTSTHGAAQTALITTSPGVLAALSANPSCLQSVQETPGGPCQLGSGTATLEGIPGAVSLTGYLVPAKDAANDVAGIDLIAGQGTPLQSTTHAEIQLKQNAAGNVSAVLNVDFAGAGAASNFVTGSSLTVNATVNGKPFTRMLSNCSPGPSSLTVTYSDGKTETTPATPDFNITGCSSLPYAPHLTATAIKDSGDAGVKLTTVVTQAPNEAATAVQALRTPGALAPNVPGVSLQNTTTPVGMVTAVSPLVPTPLVGQAFLIGTPLKPQLTLKFPPPNALSLTGTVDLQTSTVTFTGIPDVPQTQLTVTLFGGPKALEMAPCVPSSGPISGSFTGQNGRTASSSQLLVVSGCPKPQPPKPTLSGVKLSGLAKGKPALSFRLSRGAGGPKLKSFKLSLPHGLRFNPRKRGHGLSVGGGRVISLTPSNLTVGFGAGAGTIRVRLGSPLLVAKKHLNKHLQVRITVTDASGARSTLTTRT